MIAKPLNQDAEDDYDYEDDDAKPSHHHHLHVHTKGTTAPPTVATGASKPPKSEASSTTPSASHLGESAVNTSSSSSGEQAAKVAKSTTAKPGLWMVGESLSFTRSSVAPKGGNTTTAALEDGPRGDKTSQLIVPIESNDDDDDAEDSTEDYDDLGEYKPDKGV